MRLVLALLLLSLFVDCSRSDQSVSDPTLIDHSWELANAPPTFRRLWLMDEVSVTSGQVKVEKNVLEASFLTGGPRTEEEPVTDAVVLPCGACVVLARPAGTWCEKLTVLVELRQKNQGWTPVAFAMALDTDLVVPGRDVGEWLRPLVGSIMIDAPSCKVGDPLRCSFTLSHESKDGYMRMAEGRFSASTRTAGDTLDSAIRQFVRDARVEDR